MAVRGLVGEGQGGGCGQRGATLVKEHKLSVTRGVSPGDLMYTVVTVANNSILCT